MKTELIGKIISTLLALLGIWTANKISQDLSTIGDATTSISASIGPGAKK